MAAARRLFILVYPGKASHPHNDGRLRVVTYNVHKCRGLDGRVRPDRIVQVLGEIGADVIALQEVVSRESRHSHHHQARYIAENLGYQCEMGENRRHRGGAYGNLLLSRFPIRFARNHDLSVPGRERRGCLQTEIQLKGGGTLHIFNLHLGTAHFERRMQARRIFVDRLLTDGDISANRIVVGDFNEWTRGLASRLFSAHFETAERHVPRHRARTYPGVLPVLRLDHIYFDSNLHLQDVRVHRSPSALVSSDHLPVVADFQVPAA